MLIKDYEGKVEWFTDRAEDWMPDRYYIRMSVVGSRTWYEYDGYTNNLIELDEVSAEDLEERAP